jgi:hypothetical protein
MIIIGYLLLQLNESQENGSVFERERDFYFTKLRAIELMCEGIDQETGQLSVKEVVQILYDTAEVCSKSSAKQFRFVL